MQILKAVSLTACLGVPHIAAADLIFDGDGSLAGDVCIGVACVADEEFANLFTTLRLKEENTGIEFIDTSTFELSDMDWQIAVNPPFFEAFWILNNETALTPFKIDGAATENALVLGQNGFVGLSEPFPETNLHVTAFGTPTLRLEQPASQGDPTMIWDIGGNEANFFIRDQSGGTLPLRIRPGAPQNALFVDANGEVGMGIANPRGALHVRRNQPTNVPHLVLENRLQHGRTEIWFEDRDTPTDDDALRLQLRGDVFNVTFNGTGAPELQVRKDGDVRILRGDLRIASGGVVVNGSTLNVPDYVFAEDYELMPLSDVAAFIDEHAHLPHIPSAGEIAQNGLDVTAMQLALLKTVEELTLHALAQQELIETQRRQISDQAAILADMRAQLTDLRVQFSAYE